MDTSTTDESARRLASIVALWHERDFDGAFAAAVDLQLDEPHADYGAYLFAIADDAAGARHLLDRKPLFKALDASMGRTMGLLHLRAGERAPFRTWARLGARVFSLHQHVARGGGGWAPAIGLVAAGFLRRAGDFEEALRIGRIVTATANPQIGAATQEGLALRALGRFDEAAALFLRVFEQTSDATFLCEAARARFDQGRFADALALFTDARVRSDQETHLAAAACRRRLGAAAKSDAERAADDMLAVHFPDDDSNSYDDLRHVVLQDDGSFLWMGDATTNVFAQLADKDATGMRMHATHLECPSVILSCALATRGAAAVDDDVAYAFSPPAAPASFVHPALPIAADEGGAALWDVRGRLPKQALPPPPPALLTRLAPLAERNALAMPALRARVKRAALDDVDPQQLLAAMVHPPPAPALHELPYHVFAWQRALALALALQKPQQPWATSQRRASLRALILGPSDWTTAAALIALTEVLLDDLAALPDARAFIARLLAYAPCIEGHCPWAEALAHLTRRIALFPKDLLAPLDAWLAPE